MSGYILIAIVFIVLIAIARSHINMLSFTISDLGPSFRSLHDHAVLHVGSVKMDGCVLVRHGEHFTITLSMIERYT